MIFGKSFSIWAYANCRGNNVETKAQPNIFDNKLFIKNALQIQKYRRYVVHHVHRKDGIANQFHN